MPILLMESVNKKNNKCILFNQRYTEKKIYKYSEAQNIFFFFSIIHFQIVIIIMLKAILDSVTRPEELSALLKYKFAPKSESVQRFKASLAKDASKQRIYYYLNMASNFGTRALYPIVLTFV